MSALRGQSPAVAAALPAYNQQLAQQGLQNQRVQNDLQAAEARAQQNLLAGQAGLQTQRGALGVQQAAYGNQLTDRLAAARNKIVLQRRAAAYPGNWGHA